MSLRTACNHCNTPMKSRVKHQEIAGAPQDLRRTANMLPFPKQAKDTGTENILMTPKRNLPNLKHF